MKQSEQYTDDMQPDGGRKPTYIKEQHNHNCQQFFGNISNCTFMMPSAPPSEGSANHPATSSESNANPPTTSSEGSADKSGKRRKKTVTANENPLTIRYYRHGNKGIMARQRQRVDILYRKWTEWKWIDADTDPDDFDRLFEGLPRHCNIKWTGTSATLTILMQQILEQDFIEKQTNCSAKHLVAKQFGKTPNSDRSRISKDIEEKISISILILDTSSPLPQRNARYGHENEMYKEPMNLKRGKGVYMRELRECGGRTEDKTKCAKG